MRGRGGARKARVTYSSDVNGGECESWGMTRTPEGNDSLIFFTR